MQNQVLEITIKSPMTATTLVKELGEPRGKERNLFTPMVRDLPLLYLLSCEVWHYQIVGNYDGVLWRRVGSDGLFLALEFSLELSLSSVICFHSAKN